MSASASVVHVIRPAAGGMRAHVAALTPRLAQRGYDVAVAGPLDDLLRRQLSRSAVPWANLPLPDRPSLGLLVPRLSRAVQAAARPLARFLRTRDVALIHAHGFMAAAIAHVAARKLERPVPSVLTAHVLPQIRGGWAERYARRTGYVRALRRADAVIAVSAAVRDSLLDLEPEAGPKVQVVFNGLDAGRYQRRVDVGLKRRQLGLDPAAAAVGFVGRLSPEKGPDLFLEAAASLTHDIPNVDYVVVGDGPLREELENQAHDLHLTGCCVFLGQREDVPHILPALDALVVPSRAEAFGLVALEGVAAGTPVIASDVGGLSEILRDAPDVALVPPGDVGALARAIVKVLDRLPGDEEMLVSEAAQSHEGAPEARDLLVSEDEFDLDAGMRKGSRSAREGTGPAGQRFVTERFGLTAMVDQTAALYEEMLGGPTRPALPAGE